MPLPGDLDLAGTALEHHFLLEPGPFTKQGREIQSRGSAAGRARSVSDAKVTRPDDAEVCPTLAEAVAVRRFPMSLLRAHVGAVAGSVGTGASDIDM